MKSLMERMRAVAQEKGLSVSDFEQLFGLSVGSIEGLANTLSSDKIVHILDTYHDLSAEWLMRGTGEMHLAQPLGGDAQEASDEALQIGRNASIGDISITHGASEAQLEQIRLGYAEMIGKKDIQIDQLLKLVEKLTDR